MNMKIRRDAKIPAAYLSFVLEDQGSFHRTRVILGAIEALEESWIQDVRDRGNNTIAVSVYCVFGSEESLSFDFEEKTTRIDGIVDTIQHAVEEAIRSEREQGVAQREREGWGGEEERTFST